MSIKKEKSTCLRSDGYMVLSASGLEISMKPAGRYMDIFGLGELDDELENENPEDLILDSFNDVGDHIKNAARELQLNL